MATQVSLNSGAIASAGALAIQTNGTTEAVSISTGQVATVAQNPILTSGTANGVAYLNGSKALTTGSALVFEGTNLGVGIGTSSPAYKLDVAGNIRGLINNASVGNASSMQLTQNGAGDAAISFLIGATTEWLAGVDNSDSDSFKINNITGGGDFNGAGITLTTGGNLLVGTTSNTGASKTNIYQSADNTGLIVRNANASNTASVLGLSADRNTTNNSYYFIRCDVVGVAYRFQVADSGNVTNANNSYGAISDAKLKENITDAAPKLEKLNQVRIVNFNMIGDEQKQIGVIAQELEQIFPGMVEEAIDRDKEGNDLGTTTKSVKYSVFVPMLIKAMQEQQSIIQSLTVRITALEGA